MKTLEGIQPGRHSPSHSDCTGTSELAFSAQVGTLRPTALDIPIESKHTIAPYPLPFSLCISWCCNRCCYAHK